MKINEHDEHFGMLVENEMDEIRLAYLLSIIGPEKLWNSVQKEKQKWPDSKPYVSKMLKRFRVIVPTHLYAPKPELIAHTYLLVCADFSRIKYGSSGRWTERIYSFSRNCDLSEFNLDLTFAFRFTDKKQAIRAEKTIKNELSAYSVDRPEFVPYGAYGHTEWLAFSAYPLAVEILQNFESAEARYPAFFSSYNSGSPIES